MTNNSGRRRILQITDHWYPDKIGGSCKYAFELSSLLGRRHEMTTMTLAAPPHPAERGQTVIKTLSKLNLAANNLRIWRQIRRSSADCLLLHSPLAFAGSWLAARATRTPMIAVYHGPWGKEARQKYRSRASAWGRLLARFAPLLDGVDRLYLGAVRQVVFLSTYMRDQACALRDVREKSQVIPYWMTSPPPALAAESLDPPFTLIAVRRLEQRMGLQDLLKALRRAPAGTRLILVGTGTCEEMLKRQTNELGLGDMVLFAGKVSEADKRRLMGEADFMILPSLDLEGFGLVVFEALEQGLPVICREGVGFLDFATPAMAGAIIRYDTEDELGSLLSRPIERRIEPGAFCRFSPDSIAVAFDRVLAAVDQ